MCSVPLALLLLGAPAAWLDRDEADVARRTTAVADARKLYAERVRTRLRVLWRLASGGDARELVGGSDSAPTRAVRVALLRVVERDLDELRKYENEARELDRERVRLLDRQRVTMTAQRSHPAGLPRLVAPARGPVTGRFGRYREDPRLEQERRGITIRTHDGDEVRAPIDATCVSVGSLPGLGPAVVLEAERNTVIVLAPVEQPRCKVGQLVSAKRALGRVRGASLYVEVRQDGVPLDPESALDKGR